MGVDVFARGNLVVQIVQHRNDLHRSPASQHTAYHTAYNAPGAQHRRQNSIGLLWAHLRFELEVSHIPQGNSGTYPRREVAKELGSQRKDEGGVTCENVGRSAGDALRHACVTRVYVSGTLDGSSGNFGFMMYSTSSEFLPSASDSPTVPYLLSKDCLLPSLDCADKNADSLWLRLLSGTELQSGIFRQKGGLGGSS